MPGTTETLLEELRVAGIDDPRVLDAFRHVRRDLFLPSSQRYRAGEDEPVPIGHGQVATQPSLIARMLVGLRLEAGDRALEVGTGSGFRTALLAWLCAEVYSIEWFEDLAELARSNLRAAGVRNATVVAADGSLGWPEQALYQAIVVSAAAPVVPPPFIERLAEGGRLVQPIGPGGDDLVSVWIKRAGRLESESTLAPAYFVPLRGRFA